MIGRREWMTDSKRCVLAQVHRYRGTPYYRLKLYTRETFIEEVTEEGDDQYTTAPAEQIWSSNEGVEDHFRRFDTYVVSGQLDIGEHHRWLIVFDPNSQQSAQLIPREVDLDEYVKSHYLQSRRENWYGDEDEASPEHPLSPGPLDWTARKSYDGHIIRQYCSDYWGWTDGANEDEPFLINYSDGYRGMGIVIVDLDKWRAQGCPLCLETAFPVRQEDDEDVDIVEVDAEVRKAHRPSLISIRSTMPGGLSWGPKGLFYE